jgi:hypothetical protein
MGEPRISRIKCPGCFGSGLVTGTEYRGYSAALGVHFPTSVTEECDECCGTGRALCPGCHQEDLEIQDLESGRYWCSACWVRRCQEAAEQNGQDGSDPIGGRSWSEEIDDLPF